MNVSQRVISLSVFFFFLVSTYFFISNSNRIKIKNLTFLYICILSIMAYFYVPYKTADLYRIFEQIDIYYSHLSFSEFLEWAFKINTNIVSMLYYYLFAKIGLYHLLPLTNCFIFYYIIFKIYNNFVENSEILKKDAGIVFMIVMAGGQYIEVISGIRFMLAASIFIFCLYREFFKEKNIISDIPLYLASTLIHISLSIPIIFRIVFKIFQGESNSLKKIFGVVLSLGMLVFIYFFGSNFMNYVFESGYKYISTDSYSYFWEYLIAIINMYYLYLVYKTVKKINYEKYKKYYNYEKFIFVFFIFTLIMFPTYSIFHRFRTIVWFLNIPNFVFLFEGLRKNNNSSHNKNVYSITMLILFITYILIFTRGNLCGLNFFK